MRVITSGLIGAAFAHGDAFLRTMYLTGDLDAANDAAAAAAAAGFAMGMAVGMLEGRFTPYIGLAGFGFGLAQSKQALESGNYELAALDFTFAIFSFFTGVYRPLMAPGRGMTPLPTATGNVAPTGRGVWDLNPFQRDRVIEQQRGQNLPGNFPTIDRFQNGVATSIKSLDLAAPTYSNAARITSTGRRYVDSVAAFQGRNWGGVNIRAGDVTGRGLELVVPTGATQAQQQAIQGLVTYGAQNGVNVTIVVLP